MRDPDVENVQLKHKEEGTARMESDEIDRRALRDKLDMSIQPLNPEEHPMGLVIIVTDEVALNPDINVDQAVELGKSQLEAFEAGWSESFHASLKNKVIAWTANKKSINVEGHKIVDTGIFYARALALQASDRGVPSISYMLAFRIVIIYKSIYIFVCSLGGISFDALRSSKVTTDNYSMMFEEARTFILWDGRL